MGLLDDAIREHLELKRRRGADPEEIERLEQEALGPVRRGPEPVDGLAGTALAEVDVEPSPDVRYHVPPQDAPWEEEVVEEPLARESGYAAAEFEEEAEEEEEWTVEPPVAEHEPPTNETPAAPAPAPAMPAPEPERELAGETVEYDVEAEQEEEAVREPDRAEHDHPEGEREDVLEETPEFLQDTPDHDRLWFEQRPPKDFDFDG